MLILTSCRCIEILLACGRPEQDTHDQIRLCLMLLTAYLNETEYPRRSDMPLGAAEGR